MLDKDQIYELRIRLKMTAKKFADRCGVTENTVFRWEQGVRFPSRRHLVEINKMLAEASELAESA